MRLNPMPEPAPPLPAVMPTPVAPLTATGKNHSNENFPVGSWLVGPHERPAIHAFYQLVRLADDIADDPLLDPPPKLQKLRRLSDVLTHAHDEGHDAPQAVALRHVLQEKNITAQHARDLLHAFQQDAVKRRYNTWDELLDYCRYSAAPVGRYVLALHGEDEATWPANDALCAVLQITNHLQDMADDYRENDRVYLPLDILAQHGADPAMLAAATSPAPLKAAQRAMVEKLWPLLQQARQLPKQVRHFRLRLEISVIVSLATAMTHKLRRVDPLATNAKLNKFELAGACVWGMMRAWF